MPAIVYYVEGGVRKARDPKTVALESRKGVQGMFIRKQAILASSLGVRDEGLVVYSDDVASKLGGGAGFYQWDGSFFRKFGSPGAGATITCTSGESIITAAQRQLAMGATSLLLTAAGAVSPGTITTKPILPDGFHGQELILHNVSSGANSITLTDVGTMALSNLKLGAATVVLAQFKAIRLVFDSTATAGQRWKLASALSF